MTGSGPKLGVLLLVAVLLQTVVVTITVLHFTTALNSVRNPEETSPVGPVRMEKGTGDVWRLLRIASAHSEGGEPLCL